MNKCDHHISQGCLSIKEKGLKNLGLKEGSNPDLWDAHAVLYQSSYQANWEQVIMWVGCKPVDVEIDGDLRVFSYWTTLQM